jgi:hypothetical protein
MRGRTVIQVTVDFFHVTDVRASEQLHAVNMWKILTCSILTVNQFKISRKI